MRFVTDFDFKWAFSKEAEAVPASMPEKWYWVNLPHTWNAIDGQDGGNDLYRGTAYYAKELLKSDLPEGDRHYLEIEGANASASVYVNGQKLASHDGGYSTWRVDMTDALADKNLIVIEVANDKNDRVYPQNADFTFYGGLYRDVNIISVPESHFDLDFFGAPGIMVTPTVKGLDADVKVKTFITNKKAGQTVRYTVLDKEGYAVGACEGDTEADFTLQNVHKWHGRKNPYLYSVKAELVEDGKVLDTVCTRFGCRSFEIDPDKGFILNGESYPLRGVSRHQDRWGVGNALTPEMHKEDIDLIMELGATTIRLAHYQHDQYFYDLCDEMGLVIWAEIPYITTHMDNGFDNTVSQMKELIAQNYNHASIVVWGLSNEITGGGANIYSPVLLENHKVLNDLCHEWDPTRLTTMAIVSSCPVDHPYIQIPDTVSWNHYFGWYGGKHTENGPWMDEFHKNNPTIPVGMSEYGCEALNWHTSDPDQGDYTEEYQAVYHESLIRQLFTRPYIWATHVWNMFDFGADARNEGGENGQNHKGLMTFDRKYKKDSFYAYKAWLSDEPFVHLCGKRYVDRVEDVTKVTVYSNLPSVELFANGASLGVKEAPDHFFYFDVPNNGITKLEAVAGQCRDESEIHKVDTFNEAYRMKEKGAILNWWDIVEPEGYCSLNTKIEVITAAEGGKEGLVEALGLIMGEQAKTMDGALSQISSFTVIRLIGLLGMMFPVPPTKEQLLEVNARLNLIKK